MAHDRSARRMMTAVAAGAACLAVVAAAAATMRDPRTPALPGVSAADRASVAGFPGWTRLTQPPPAPESGLGAAHPGVKRIYASPRRAVLARDGRRRFPYPVGTRIVKTGTTNGAITLLALMRKVARAGRSDGGWDFVEYQRASASEPFRRVALPESGCAGCHANARETDWVFSSVPGK